MGSVRPYKTAAGKRYEVRYLEPDGSKGGKRGFERKRDAELWLAEVESSRAKGNFVDPKAARVTIDALGETWLEAKRHSMKPSSFAPVATAWRLRVQPTWGRWEVGDIRHTDVRAWVAKLTNETGATVTIRTFGVLASILDDAVFDGRIPNNPARMGRVGLPKKSRGRHGYLTHQEVIRLAEASGERKLLVLVLAYTGIRWGEAAALRVRDLDLDRGRLHVTANAVEVHGKIHEGTPKSHKGRLVPIPRFLVQELRTAVEDRPRDALVFPGKDGQFMRRARSDSGSKSWFKSALTKADLPIMTTHDLRHTAASLAVQAGANVKTIQRMLGHTSAAMTLDVYSDLFDTDLDAVSAALDSAAEEAGIGALFAREDPAD
ncbi:site-specific integrase [Microbacterium sp. dk485]|nr:site-specific integrase [Microbacterium sp. dk485]